MIAVILDAGAPESCHPLTCTRPLAACPVANLPLRAAQERELAAAKLPLPCPGDTDGQARLFLRGDAWVPAALLARLANLGACAAAVRAADGCALAWIGHATAPPPEPGADDLTGQDTFRLCYPWDLLRLNELLVGALTEDAIEGEVARGVTLAGHVTLGRGSRLLPGVYIEGNVVIGRDCKIGPNCYIRGSTAIGDNCHIGQAVEVKNSILLPGAAIGHLSYCGDSIVGEKTNFGAGTITANFRHDGKQHRSTVGSQLVDTGRRKFGAIIGDDVHTGIHTSIYPGRKLWPHTSTRPGAIVSRDLLTGEA